MEHTVALARDALVAALHLQTDPFRHSVTEQETNLNFAEVYVEPQASLLTQLQQPTTTLVFADHGMGKSATRLALEYHLRLSPDHPPALCVRYTPLVRSLNGPLLAAHLQQLHKQLIIDVIIQAFERCNRSWEPISPTWGIAFQREAALLPRHLQSSWIARGQSAPPNGVFWDAARPVVEELRVGPRWHRLIGLLEDRTWPKDQKAAWNSSVDDARALGFGRIFILIDALDEETADPVDWNQLLAPLLEHLTVFREQGVFLKCFLPLRLKPLIEARYTELWRQLTPEPMITTIASMSMDDLKRILQDRIRATTTEPGSNLDLLLGEHLTESIEDWLVAQAKGSPRTLLLLASELFDFQAAHGFRVERRSYLTADEWDFFQRRVRDKEVLP